MDFDALRALARHQRQNFGRQIHTEVYKTQEGYLALTRLHDDVHDMQLALLIDPEQLVIKVARGTMERFPFGTCPMATASLERLEGMAIQGKGVLKEAHHRIPREQGCTHLAEMLETTLRTMFAFVSTERADPARKRLPLEERRHLLVENPVLGGSCLSFSHQHFSPEVAAAARQHLVEERARQQAGEATPPTSLPR